jgi:opacity protein-like surface antigen
VRVRLAVFVTSAASLISVAAGAQSTSPAPATNPSHSERATDDWTGFYAGANFGHVSQEFSEQALLFVGADGTVHRPGTALGPGSAGSGTVGFQVGYDMKLMRRLVGGLEVQLTRSSPLAFGLGNGVLDVDLRSFRGGLATTPTARLGATISKALLAYGTAGAALTHITAVDAIALPGVIVNPAAATVSGLALGFGAEYTPGRHGVLSHLRMGADFRHVSPGTRPFPLVSLYNPVSIPGTLTSHTNQFDVRVNYRFSGRRR